ncbi:MAG: hypothetical protein PHD37_06685 [Gallionellaceae bacterium]|nr:hypothetical protein [Gallionellaceae bacterium]
MNSGFIAGFAELPAQDQKRYQRAVEQAIALGTEKEEMRARFEKLRGDTRVETQIWKLTQFDAYLDRLRESYCETSDLLGLSVEPADGWPLLDFDKLPKGEEVHSLVLLVTLKHERLQAMPLVTLLDGLRLNGSGRVH